MQRNHRTKQSKGFTLIELMVIVAIIGILSAIAIPYYRAYLVESHAAAVVSSISPLKTAITTKASRGEIEIGVLGANGAITGGATNPALADLDLNIANLNQLTTNEISAFALGAGYAISLTLQNIAAGVDAQTITFTPASYGVNVVWVADSSNINANTGEAAQVFGDYLAQHFTVAGGGGGAGGGAD